MIISVQFDTVTKEGTVTMDGQEVDDVREVCLYNMDWSDPENKFYMELRTVDRDEDNSIVTITSVQASENGNVQTTSKTEPSKKLQEDILKLFNN